MKVKFKKLHELAVLPSYAKAGDAGLDITTIANGTVTENSDPTSGGLWYYAEYKTGLACEIPDGYVGLLFPRSSISKSALILSNAVGVLDSGYRGEICFRFKIDAGLVEEAERLNVAPALYKQGDRVGQLIVVPYPTIEPEFADELSDTNRGSSGFGSSGA